MNNKERERERVFAAVKSKSFNLKKAQVLLKLSYAQTKRLWSRYKKQGAKGLISQKRGRKSNRAASEDEKKSIIEIINEHYYNCKPLYISEVLKEHHNINRSSEFIRQLMIEHHLWVPKKRKVNIHQRRDRRECRGEMAQADASQHDWFEGRLLLNGEPVKAHLHIFVDDATTEINGGYFDYQETTKGYSLAAMSYFEERGTPIDLYVDMRGTFKVNSGSKRGKTQFQRAMEELNVNIIYARSPEAKGRVERVFGTLQERLIWEMRRLKISTLEEANKFLPSFFRKFNERFSVKPANAFDAHRELNQKKELKYILCIKEERKLTKNFEVQLGRQKFIVVSEFK